MSKKQPETGTMDFTVASERAVRVRSLYRQLEERNHGGAWTTEEDMLAFATDIGVLGRLVMAAEGRWVYGGNVQTELTSKLAECLWWILVLADRLDVDINEAFTAFMDRLDSDLETSVSTAPKHK